MKRILLSFALLLSSSICGRAQELSELAQPPNGDNQKAKVSQWIGLVEVSIAYHSPRVHFNEKFFTYVGLARGYTALGDKANAIKNWEIALKNVPDSQKPNLPVYEKALGDLKK